MVTRRCTESLISFKQNVTVTCLFDFKPSDLLNASAEKCETEESQYPDKQMLFKGPAEGEKRGVLSRRFMTPHKKLCLNTLFPLWRILATQTVCGHKTAREPRRYERHEQDDRANGCQKPPNNENRFQPGRTPTQDGGRLGRR